MDPLLTRAKDLLRNRDSHSDGGVNIERKFLIKRLIPFVATVLLALATPSWATTYTATSCTAAAVQTAINSAADGDTVLVPNTSCPAGSATTWNSPVKISKGIYFNGQGSAIAFGSGSSLSINADSAHGTLVENFNFQNGFTNGGCPIQFYITPSTAPFRFSANTHTDTTHAAPTTAICVYGLGAGLIDHNTFTATNGADEVIHLMGQGPGSANWTDNLTPGSPNMVYIETNTFNNNAGTTGAVMSAEEAYYGAEFVFRNNTLNYAQNDIHGGDSGRWSEVYSNTYTYNTVGGSGCYMNFAQIRGGSGLYYGNHVSGGPGCNNSPGWVSVGPNCGSSDICSGTWAVPRQLGRGINTTTYSPVYIWGNDTTIQSHVTQSGGQNLAAVGGSTSGCGSSHPGGVCDAVATTAQPTLTRCQSSSDVQAGCPVAYSYSAFTYPYPLTADGLPAPSGGGTTQPSNPGAPTSLQASAQ